MRFNYEEVRQMFKRELQHDMMPSSYEFNIWLIRHFKETIKDNNGRCYEELDHRVIGQYYE
jgi:formylmethanofuran dehydrogenase subunit E-like metal-binding protein